MTKDKLKTKSRLGVVCKFYITYANRYIASEEDKEAIKSYALYYHKDIVSILDVIKRELLLVLKTNSYLRAIDNRLGNPTNSFNTIVSPL